MKKYRILFALVVIFTAVIISGCKTPNWQGNLDCNLSRSEIAKKTLDILTEEKFTIISASEFMITATSESWFKLFQGMQRIEWLFRIEENKILGTATLCNRKVGAFVDDNQYTLNDDAGDNLTEYWRVRRKLEKICNNTMIIINTRSEEHSTNQNDDEFNK
jgi:hypothetical protein